MHQMMPMLKYFRPGSSPIFGTPFLIKKLSFGADFTTNLSQISQIKQIYMLFQHILRLMSAVRTHPHIQFEIL